MKYFIGLLLILIVSSVSVFFYIQHTSLPISADTTTKNFVINQGDGLKIISTRLENNHLIQSRFTFLLLAHQLKLNNSLQAGLFRLSPSMSTTEIITKLSTGGNHDYWLKIIEGQRLAEIKTSFDPKLEGYLFPDSYLIPPDYTPDNIAELIGQNFQKKLSQAKIEATNLDMTDAQIITFASVLEREGRSLLSKQNIAGILLNRLKINMPLQVDASVQYARDTRLKPQVYWTPIQKSDLAINSPYNTYLNPGLPPTPICNPGYDAIYAVLHPIASDNLFYITGNDNQMHYARTLDEHNANIAKYLR